MFLIGVPPAWAAYRAIANEYCARAFIFTYLLPRRVLFVLLFAYRWSYGEKSDHVSGPLVLGIPPQVLVRASGEASKQVNRAR